MALERTVPRPWPAPADRSAKRRAAPMGSPRSGRRLVRPASGALVGLAITAALLGLALAGPWLVAIDPNRQDLVTRLAPPLGLGGTVSHPLGTDGLGRDLLARLIVGARLSLLIGVVATLVAGAIGVALGLVAGAGGVAARLVNWLTEVQLAVPFVVVAIALTSVLGNGWETVVLTLVVTGWVGYARVVRLQTRSLRAAPWLEAARSLGAGPARIALRHLLPNLAGPVIVLAGQQVAAMILYEAALSYLGLGLGGDVATWGGMVADGQEALLTAWWVSVVPGAAVALTVLGLNLVGDALATGIGRSGGGMVPGAR